MGWAGCSKFWMDVFFSSSGLSRSTLSKLSFMSLLWAFSTFLYSSINLLSASSRSSVIGPWRSSPFHAPRSSQKLRSSSFSFLVPGFTDSLPILLKRSSCPTPILRVSKSPIHSSILDLFPLSSILELFPLSILLVWWCMPACPTLMPG